VDLSYLHSVPGGGGEVGSFTILPEEKRVHYRRSSSTFWQEQPDSYPWKKIFKGKHGSNGAWVHATGITPLCGPQARARWDEHLQACATMSVPVSIDFNHRPALGTLEELWNIMVPQLTLLGSNLKFIVFSLKTVRQIAVLCGVANVPEPSSFELAGTPIDDNASGGGGGGKSITDPCWFQLLIDLRELLLTRNVLDSSTALGTCFKTRNEHGIQTRWSAVATASGIHTTIDIPTLHVPKDECGGGSAFSVGCIDELIRFPQSDWRDVLRRGDLSAALCQEVVGDHSDTSGATLDGCVSTYSNRLAVVGNAQHILGRTFRGSDGSTRTNLTREERMEKTIQTMGVGRVVAILRAKNADLAIARGIELVTELGATAIEVTVDTVDFERVLSSLVTAVGDRALVGVGTVMHAADVRRIADLGAVFALSPINPQGFVVECLKCGIVPVPAAFTPTEVWEAYQQGAQIVKLFPAYLWQPTALKAMLTTGELSKVKICPSGGISPESSKEWFDAGAFAVGMGTHLAGKDVKISKDDPNYEEKINVATAHWEKVGREGARTAIASLRKS